MNEQDDKMREEEQRVKELIRKGSSQQEADDDDTGAQLSPERPIGSQRKATSSSRTPSNET